MNVIVWKTNLRLLWKNSMIIARKFGQMIRKDVFKLSIGLSLFLLFLNLVIITYGQNSVRKFVLPSKLKHGFLPVYPNHYFHSNDLLSSSKNQSSESIKINEYLHHHTAQNSLSYKVPPVVHVVWCERSYFNFVNYLSVISAFKVIRPSVIYLHVLRQPEMDSDGYYQFLPDLKRDIPSLVLSTLKHTGACSDDPKASIAAYIKIIKSTGGIVIDAKTILSPSPELDSVLNSEITLLREHRSNKPLMFSAQRDVLNEMKVEDDLRHNFGQGGFFDRFCIGTDSFSFGKKHFCVYVQHEIFPSDIFDDKSAFGHLARWVGYGSSRFQKSVPSDTDIVPNIVHYVWLGQNYLGYFGYLSLLSSLHIFKADNVYIHGNFEPKGDYWKEAVKDKRINFIHRDFPPSVYGEPIKKFASHASDYLRADVLLRYGGVYIDWDVIFVRPMWPSLRRHNTTANVDWPKTGAFPDVINLGVLIAAPGAPFLRHFMESYRWYLDNHWSYNAIHMPYKVYEKIPSSLNIDRHAQVSCAVGNCHATWLEGYKDNDLDHLKSSSLNWKTDVFAFHWTHPDPKELTDRELLLKSNTIAGDIGKFVLQAAGMYKPDS